MIFMKYEGINQILASVMNLLGQHKVPLLFIHSFIHSFIRPFLYRPFKFFTTQRRSRLQHGYCIGVSRRSAQATAGKGLAQGPYVMARVGVEPTTLRLKVIDSTKAPSRPTSYVQATCAHFGRSGTVRNLCPLSYQCSVLHSTPNIATPNHLSHLKVHLVGSL